MHKLIFN